MDTSALYLFGEDAQPLKNFRHFSYNLYLYSYKTPISDIITGLCDWSGSYDPQLEQRVFDAASYWAAMEFSSAADAWDHILQISADLNGGYANFDEWSLYWGAHWTAAGYTVSGYEDFSDWDSFWQWYGICFAEQTITKIA